MPARRTTPGPLLVSDPASVSAQHRVLVPQHQQLSIFRQAADRQDSQAKYPASQQVDDLEQHQASQPPSCPRLLAKEQVNRAIDYSSGTGSAQRGPRSAQSRRGRRLVRRRTAT